MIQIDFDGSRRLEVKDYSKDKFYHIDTDPALAEFLCDVFEMFVTEIEDLKTEIGCIKTILNISNETLRYLGKE